MLRILCSLGALIGFLFGTITEAAPVVAQNDCTTFTRIFFSSTLSPDEKSEALGKRKQQQVSWTVILSRSADNVVTGHCPGSDAAVFAVILPTAELADLRSNEEMRIRGKLKLNFATKELTIENAHLVNDTSHEATGVDVLVLLKKAGYSMKGELSGQGLLDVFPGFKDRPDIKDGGLISEGSGTLTDDAEISVSVFKNPDLRNNARLRVIKALPGRSYFLECGSILVDITPDKELSGTAKRKEFDRYLNLKQQGYKMLAQRFDCE